MTNSKIAAVEIAGILFLMIGTNVFMNTPVYSGLSNEQKQAITGGVPIACFDCDTVNAVTCEQCIPVPTSSCKKVGLNQYGIEIKDCIIRPDKLLLGLAGKRGCTTAGSRFTCKFKIDSVCNTGSGTSCGKQAFPVCQWKPADMMHTESYCEGKCETSTFNCKSCSN